MAKRKIPFALWPYSWGLSGQERELARAKYYLEGEALDRAVLDIEHTNKESKRYRMAKLEIDHKYQEISEYEYQLEKLKSANLGKETRDYRIAKLSLDLEHGVINQMAHDYQLLELQYPDHESEEYQLAKLNLQLQYNEISQNEYDKQGATITGQPWFTVLKGEYKTGKNDRNIMSFDLDWNDVFVEKLRSEGWTGADDNQLVDAWFEEVCKQMLEKDFEDYDAVTTSTMRATSTTRTKKNKNGKDGLTEYS